MCPLLKPISVLLAQIPQYLSGGAISRRRADAERAPYRRPNKAILIASMWKEWPARRLGVAALQRRDHATMLVRNNHAAGLRERFALELDPSIAAPDNLQDGMNAGQQLFAGGGEQPLTAS